MRKQKCERCRGFLFWVVYPQGIEMGAWGDKNGKVVCAQPFHKHVPERTRPYAPYGTYKTD